MIQRTWITSLMLLLSSLGLSYGQSAVAKASRAEEVLPPDAPAVFVIRDLPALRKKFLAHPFARAIADPRFKNFFAPATKIGAFINPDFLVADTGLKFHEILDLFPGQIAIAFDPAGEMGLRPAEDGVPEWVLLADIGDNSAGVEKLLKAQIGGWARNVAAPAVERTEAFEGVTLHLYAPPIVGPPPAATGG